MLILPSSTHTRRNQHFPVTPSWRWCLQYQSCYAWLRVCHGRAVSNCKLFFEFRNDFTRTFVPTCLPTYVNGGWVKEFMSKQTSLTKLFVLFFTIRTGWNFRKRKGRILLSFRFRLPSWPKASPYVKYGFLYYSLILVSFFVRRFGVFLWRPKRNENLTLIVLKTRCTSEGHFGATQVSKEFTKVKKK
jgi:hypothetical protein